MIKTLAAVLIGAAIATPSWAEPRYLNSPLKFTYADENQKPNALADILDTIAMWDSFLDEVAKEKEPVILLTGYGGWAFAMKIVVTRINYIQVTTGVRVVAQGYLASAHANAVCMIKNVEMGEGALLMFHAPVDEDGVYHMDDSLFDDCVKKGILSKEEVKLIANGKEVWIRYGKDGQKIKTVYAEDRRIKKEAKK